MQMCDVKCNHLDVIKQLVISTLVQLDFLFGFSPDVNLWMMAIAPIKDWNGDVVKSVLGDHHIIEWMKAQFNTPRLLLY